MPFINQRNPLFELFYFSRADFLFSCSLEVKAPAIEFRSKAC
jgi:hypothetical protein